eukprot:9480429-Pyramimonas_sp.AAC.1
MATVGVDMATTGVHMHLPMAAEYKTRTCGQTELQRLPCLLMTLHNYLQLLTGVLLDDGLRE